ncbi:MAG: sigma factor-like helix-turn-helix DNA-binding protein, partial [Bacteroidota bacterium]|nr:sigma factor-like helix-turn-helix DNA-binding protein [Bacteroidota bacterium]
LFNFFKKGQRFNVYSSHVSEDKPYDFDLSIEETIIENETVKSRGKTLSHVLNDLPSRQKEIIYYRFYEGLEYEEICELMDLKYQSAYNLLQRALSELREIYGASFMSLLLLSISLGAESTI